ncbi:MAG: methylmalonyl-CoA mutase family protein, partial [Firmicutes bacterium]|nr:methylmalonyl-CoA mutase family protein [Bacillota bacterium]
SSPSGQAVVGITGTGGAGKSSLTDELVLRFLRDFPEQTVAVLSIDPSRQKTGGALLGDRIRMNSIFHPRVYMRSLATRQSGSEITAVLPDALLAVRASGYDLIFVETSGIGQGDAAIARIADVSVYVMTSEFGAPSQLEKIDMLDFADIVAINKFDRRGSEDALRDVRKQIQRNRARFAEPVEAMPVFGTIASQFHDIGVNTLYKALIETVRTRCQVKWTSRVQYETGVPVRHPIIPSERTEYLRDVARTVREYHQHAAREAELASLLYRLEGARAVLIKRLAQPAQSQLHDDGLSAYGTPASGGPAVMDTTVRASRPHPELQALDEAIADVTRELGTVALALVRSFPELKARYQAVDFVTEVRGKELKTPLYVKSLSGLSIPKVALPEVRDYGDQLRFLLLENVPGAFPFTAGVFPLKRTDEEPRRQFAGEGTPERTNARFHYLSKDDRAKRLSTAFDSVTLYGEDPDYRPDIYGKVGESGVSICCLDDMEKLYAGFDLCDPLTSVSMTINGPAPIILAMFLNAAINQQWRAFEKRTGQAPTASQRSEIAERTLASVRGTVQADILKEDQGQNTCIFSTEFALRMMGDVQQYFIDHRVQNFYSVSISGYHIAEAGANPISQLAFTLSNGFTFVEYYLSR